MDLKAKIYFLLVGGGAIKCVWDAVQGQVMPAHVFMADTGGGLGRQFSGPWDILF